MRNYLKIFIIVITNCIYFSAPSFSQKPQYLFNQINMENGLSNNSVTCIFIDSRGFAWIGTAYGLNRYDGYSFVIFKHDPSNINSISDNFISAIIEDFEGNLWIGTQGGGLIIPLNNLLRIHQIISKDLNFL